MIEDCLSSIHISIVLCPVSVLSLSCLCPVPLQCAMSSGLVEFVLVDDLLMLFCLSRSDELMSTVPEEAEFQHSIEIITESSHRGLVKKHASYYSTAEGRDSAFSSCTLPAVSPQFFHGKRVLVRLSALRLVNQDWSELTLADMHVYREGCDERNEEYDPRQMGEHCINFYWMGKDEPTLVRYSSKVERDEDALALFELLKKREAV